MISTSKLSDCSYTMHGLIVFKCKFPDTKYQLGSGLTLIQKDKTMPDKLLYITSILHKITSSVVYNLWLKHLDTQLNEPINQNSIKSP